MQTISQNLSINQKDSSSHSNPEEISISHVDFNLRVDFKTKTIGGYADLTLQINDPTRSKLILDITTLKIESVTDLSDGKPLKYSFSELNKILGYALTIELARSYSDLEKPKIRIVFATAPEASALQWLEPSQTLGKKHPYMFSQCEEIHARSLIPAQDTPGVKFTFSAKIAVEKPLRALLGGILVKEESEGDFNVFYYEQKIPISSYLFAVAAGDISYVDISPRIRVYSEEGYLEKSKYEFEPAEQFLKTAEDILTPYEWTRYDMLVLPPSFPFGGMENPCLTFLSPTVLAGDRSLVSVVIHEMTHSWIGNLVTNATWSHFWINEGINVYHERKVIEEIYGESVYNLEVLQGLKKLEAYIRNIGEKHPFTILVTNLEGIDPDDAFSPLYYEKGFFLCLYLEQLFGREFMKYFFKEYVKEFRLQAITSNDFYDFLKEKVEEKLLEEGLEKLKKVDWDAWFHQPGCLPQPPKLEYKDYTAVKELAQKFFENLDNIEKLAGHDELVAGKWPTVKVVLFFEVLAELIRAEKKKIDTKALDWLDQQYKFSDRNAEIACKWFELCILQGYTGVDAKLEQFLTTIGRMKFVKPLFAGLVQAGRLEFAKSIYNKNVGFKHSLEIKLIGDLLTPKKP